MSNPQVGSSPRMIDMHALLTRWPEIAAKATELGVRAAVNAKKLAAEVERDAMGVAAAAVAFAREVTAPLTGAGPSTAPAEQGEAEQQEQ